MATFIIRISELGSLDGEYRVELPLTNRELHTIKRLSGVRAGEIGDAFNAKDSDLVVALATIGLERGGKAFSTDQLWDTETGRIVLDAEDDEEEAKPDGPPASPSPIEPADGDGNDVAPAPSGPASSDVGDLPENDLSRTGSQD